MVRRTAIILPVVMLCLSGRTSFAEQRGANSAQPQQPPRTEQTQPPRSEQTQPPRAEQTQPPPAREESAGPNEEKVSQTSHTVRLDGRDVRYTATTGTLPIRSRTARSRRGCSSSLTPGTART